MLALGVVEQDADEGFAVFDLAAVHHGNHFGERGHEELDALVVLGGGFAQGQVFGEHDVHGLGKEAGAGVVAGVAGPFGGAIAGFFDQLAFGGGHELFARLDAAGGELEQKLAGGVAVLADEQDAGVGGIGLGVHGEDDDGAAVAHNVALGGNVAGLAHLVGGDVEDAALVDGLGGEDLGGAGEVLAGAVGVILVRHEASIRTASETTFRKFERAFASGGSAAHPRVAVRALSMQIECYPISSLPGGSALFQASAEAEDPAAIAQLRRWYPTDPFRLDWTRATPVFPAQHCQRLADELLVQANLFEAGEPARANIERLRNGAAAVVSGQQVGLFGGPLLTFFKAATAIRKAQDATRISGREHVPVFWLASEDHDVLEADQVHLPSKSGIAMLRAGVGVTGVAVPAGSLPVGKGMDAALARAEELLGFAPICEVLRAAYTDAPGYTATMASGFGRLLSQVFAAQGLIVMDASSRAFHALGVDVLRAGIERAEELETALVERSAELERAGYHAQVKVAFDMSLLFLLAPTESGVMERRALRWTRDGGWKAGNRGYTTAELLAILEAEPERLSPNALLRPVFQDAILPTAAYVGGPAEIAYFAQSAVVFERILGRVTAVLPRLSATLVEPSVEVLLAKHEVQFLQVIEAKTAENLALRLGARSMPVEAKRKLAAAGNALDAELTPLLEYMAAMSPELGRSAGVSASKMRYQMNRLRRMAARFQMEREGSLRKQAEAIVWNLYPDEHPQERLLGGVWFLARLGDGSGYDLAQVLVDHAGQECAGHRVLFF